MRCLIRDAHALDQVRPETYTSDPLSKERYKRLEFTCKADYK